MWCQHAGYDPAVVKAKAVVEAREPKDAAEVRSFLGLVDFKARFTFHPYANLQRMENQLCGIRNSNNRLMS